MKQKWERLTAANLRDNANVKTNTRSRIVVTGKITDRTSHGNYSSRITKAYRLHLRGNFKYQLEENAENEAEDGTARTEDPTYKEESYEWDVYLKEGDWKRINFRGVPLWIEKTQERKFQCFKCKKAAAPYKNAICKSCNQLAF